MDFDSSLVNGKDYACNSYFMDEALDILVEMKIIAKEEDRVNGTIKEAKKLVFVELTLFFLFYVLKFSVPRESEGCTFTPPIILIALNMNIVAVAHILILKQL